MDEQKYKIDIKVYFNNKRILKIDTAKDYYAFRKNLAKIIPEQINLSYMNNSGVFVDLNDERTYDDFLNCSNGIHNYVECFDQRFHLARDDNLVITWKCVRCHTINYPDRVNCRTCSYQKH